MNVIVFPFNGRVALIVPAPEFSDQVDAVAEKDVPDGLPWRVMSRDELPPYERREDWRWTDSGPLGLAE